MTRRINWQKLKAEVRRFYGKDAIAGDFDYIDVFASRAGDNCGRSSITIDGTYHEAEALALFDAIASSIETDEPQKRCATCMHVLTSAGCDPCDKCCWLEFWRIDKWEPVK